METYYRQHIKGLTRERKNVAQFHRHTHRDNYESRTRPDLNEPNREFRCGHCKSMVSTEALGTAYRNHCPNCLWSKHVDHSKSGDRRSICRSAMAPVALTFKHEGYDRYGIHKQGELMLVHQCTGCGAISINRLAGDDNPIVVEQVYRNSLLLDPETLRTLETHGVTQLTATDETELMTQLYGKPTTSEEV